MVSTRAADHCRSEAPTRQAYNSRHSPDNVRPRRFKALIATCITPYGARTTEWLEWKYYASEAH
ncbi:hypothetical protein JHK84_048556 [Glycine max]|nr:hypothetical protein JHK87_048314 [Glycine soja]KAG5103587.1 hypothetical protein JHK84_048556 [Glycine max]KAH1203985.1 hypothetical protein GmHk_17G050059 [Glycine max]